MTELGRLEKVDLRNAWATEAGDFTPWLAGEENIRLLSETVGLELEVQATEKEVGPFRADILCKDEALVWGFPDFKDKYISVRALGIEPSAREQWGEQHEWLLLKLIMMDKVFRPRFAALRASGEPESIDA